MYVLRWVPRNRHLLAEASIASRRFSAEARIT
jgi:hypothetical protein